VHAQDRLAQMVWLQRTARGRAAELAGRSALPADRLARTLGLARAAELQVQRLDPTTRAALAAYAAGVNAHIERIRSGAVAPPLALRRVDATLEAWTPVDTLAVVKLYAWGLAGSLDESVFLADLIEQLGGLEAKPFFPRSGEPASPPPQQEAARAPARQLAAPPRPDPLAAAAGLLGVGVGSSAWVVGGRLSASGRPLLAGDAHLDATVPAFFYEAHLRGGGLDVAGATLPGVPVFWTGHNRRVAWAATNARADVTDLYVETVRPGTPGHYHDGTAWRPLLERKEAIEVRGGSAQPLVVRETPHGPLVNPLLEGEREPLALAWPGARPGDGVSALLRAAHAENAAEFRAALAAHHEPALVFVFADADGAGGLQLAGFLPRRSLPTGLVPVPGRGDTYEWRGAIPFEALPQRTLAPGGWLIASDGELGEGEASSIEWLWRGGERSARIEELLREATAHGPLDLRSLAALQADVRSPRALSLARAALELAGDPAALGAEGRDAVSLLRDWDGSMSVDSVGAALYHLFLQRLMQGVLERRLGPALAARYLALRHVRPLDPVADLLLEAGALAPDERSALAEDVRRCLREAWLQLAVRAGPNREKWAWGRIHTVRFRPLPFADPATEAELGPFPVDGDGDTVDTAAFDPRRPFEVSLASTYRFAADTAELEQTLSTLAPGQSEHPGHVNRSDGVARWLAGRPRLLFTSQLVIDDIARARLVLAPDGAAAAGKRP
jgi:penicillin amidase